MTISKIKKIILTASAVFLSSLIFSCGNAASQGIDVPEGISTSLQEVLANPEKYHDQTVVLEGVAGAVCPSGCDVSLSESGSSATVFSEGFTFPSDIKQKNLKIVTKVTHGKGSTVLTGLGYEVK